MNKPKMIIFDYGQTLVNEKPFDELKGTKAVLKHAANNPNNISAEEIQALADELNRDIGRYGVDLHKQPVFEIHTHIFQNYLYEYFHIELTKSPSEVERIFENNATDAEPTENIAKFLQFLSSLDIRTSVISNISFSGDMLKERINRYIPTHSFEFIIASSEYAFRKPHKRIFELALRKARLDASEVWYIGDNAVFDVDGASNCGIFSVWYKGALEESNKYIPQSSCLEISDWSELIELLDIDNNFIIRPMLFDDINTWIKLAHEFDKVVKDLVPDIRVFYEGFDEYMEAKIEKNEAFMAVDKTSGDCVGIVAFSKKNNRITFFAVSEKSDAESVGSRLVEFALSKLDSTKDISVNVLRSQNRRVMQEKRLFQKMGFEEVDDNVIESGVPACMMKKYSKWRNYLD